MYDQFLNSKNRWKLSSVGLDIYGKLLGLKNFLKEFSVIDERKIDELLIWDDYLIYSVMFGLNTKIVDDFKRLVVVENISSKVI